MHCLSTLQSHVMDSEAKQSFFGFKIILDLTCGGDFNSLSSVINLVSVKVIQQVISA